MTAQAGDTSTSSAAADKAAVRSQLRRKRAALSKRQRQLAARRAAHNAWQWRALRRARRVALYLAVGSELDTRPLLERLHRAGRRVYIPAVDAQRRMRFVPLKRGTKLRRDALGLMSTAARRPVCNPRRLDAVVMPLVGFTPGGFRLGAGGGYYDRGFAFRLERPAPPRLYGYGYALQQLGETGIENWIQRWDVPLDVLAGERRLRLRLR